MYCSIHKWALHVDSELCVCNLKGRIIDHVRNSQSVGLEDLHVLVLDEADKLLNMGFKEEVSVSCASMLRQIGISAYSLFGLVIPFVQTSTKTLNTAAPSRD